MKDKHSIKSQITTEYGDCKITCFELEKIILLNSAITIHQIDQGSLKLYYKAFTVAYNVKKNNILFIIGFVIRSIMNVMRKTLRVILGILVCGESYIHTASFKHDAIAVPVIIQCC